jgi:bifunctional polynucleotide phosphatase/kinase
MFLVSLSVRWFLGYFKKMKLTYEAVPSLDPPTAKILPDTAGTELVVFLGFPCLGKSTFFRRHFAPAGYTHINQDTLGSRSKCMKAAEVALKAGTSCVVGEYM